MFGLELSDHQYETLLRRSPDGEIEGIYGFTPREIEEMRDRLRTPDVAQFILSSLKMELDRVCI